MKFRHGHRLLLPGVEAILPISLYDVHFEGKTLVASGFSREASSAAELVGGALITARMSAPLPNVLHIQLTHFKGRQPRRPDFQLASLPANPAQKKGQGDHKIWLQSGNLRVSVPLQGEWRLAFTRSGQALTESGPGGLALMQKNGQSYLRERLSLAPGELVYGLGEHFTPFVRNGQAIDMWNEDGGTDSESAYKNIPFYLTSRGYGVLVNQPERVSFEVASHHVTSVEFSLPGHSLNYYIFGGPSPKEVLEQYTALTGRPALPPDWSFGLWLSTSFLTNYDEPTILNNIDRMAASGIPVKVFHFDCFWMKGLTWSSFLWDSRYFPDPAGLLQRIHARNVKVCLWINPYIAEASPLFEQGASSGYLLKTVQGDVYQVDDWQPGMGLVDFTNPAARQWFTSKLGALLEMGVDAFKTDFGERIPVDACYFDGSDPLRMHNYYTYLYNQTVFELLEQAKGRGQAVVFARSGTTGSQKYPLHWSGDNSSTYPSMAETLRGGLSLGLCGFGFWSHDISGFIGTATPDLYKRWVAFGLLSSHSRLHGSETPRLPWLFDEESVAVLRFFNDLKERLLPYVLDLADEAHEHGWPVLRAMLLEFPEDPTCRTLELQYMLGPALLVAPVFDPAGMVEYYLPAGAWRNIFTGEIAHGPMWRNETHDYFSLPLWVHMERGAKWNCLK